MRHYTYFAQAYGQGAFGACDYSNSSTAAADQACVSASSGAGSGSNPGSGLADTGLMIAIFVTLACVIVFAALAVRVMRRSKARTGRAPKTETI